ncbi:hypothetical protein AMAG_10069 [Allomyces macrogynus ATCC 38327]|uniref:BZIP domain-containing protein n=1 Tax=Allomyces macrogynus (strain ATCC 38327) TaxID=578462 RepID=A0A0L0SQ92_ALLM3|nr:hypothetical protein AMAG_10069 [Allomyces macrogynus ATCC 38327]|eukprot:KNE64718.1 hypothetical protein AMAG_10069 [Allomyces macrogynus ATCC 38327]
MAYHSTTSPTTHAPASWSTDLAAADPVAHSQLLASLLDLPDDDDDVDRRHDAPAPEDIAQQLALFSETQFTFANDDVMPNAARMQQTQKQQTQAPQLDGFLAMGMAASLFGTSAPKPQAFAPQQQQPAWPSVLAPYQQQQQAPTPAVVVPSHPPLYHGVGNAVLGMSPWLPVASAASAAAVGPAASAPAHVTYVLQTTATGQTVMVPVQLAPAPPATPAPAPVVAPVQASAPAVTAAAAAPAPQWTTTGLASAAPTAPNTPSPPTTPRLATKRAHVAPAAVAPAPTPKSPEEPRVRSTVETPHVHIAPTMPSADLSSTSTEPASKRPRTDADDDKRRRNTAASARFRARKKQREQATAMLARDMASKADALSQRVVELETEIAWLRGLLVDRDGHERAAQAARFAVQAAQAGVVPPRTAPDAGGYLAALEAARKAAAAVAAVPPGAVAVVAGAAAPAASSS